MMIIKLINKMTIQILKNISKYYPLLLLIDKIIFLVNSPIIRKISISILKGYKKISNIKITPSELWVNLLYYLKKLHY